MCESFTKCCSMFWCFLFLFMGLMVLGVGIWYPVDPFVYDTIIMEDPSKIEDTVQWRGFLGGLIAVGSFGVIVGILGMVATGCRSTETLIAFLVLGSLCVIGAIALGSVASIKFAQDYIELTGNNNEQEQLATVFANNLKQYYLDEDNTGDFEDAWNRYQGFMGCCAVHNFTTEYDKSAFQNNSGHAVPYSCCVMEDPFTFPVEKDNVLDLAACRAEASVPPLSYEFLNTRGCWDDIFFRWIFDRSMIVGFTWISALLQIIALIVAGCYKDDTKVNTWTV